MHIAQSKGEGVRGLKIKGNVAGILLLPAFNGLGIIGNKQAKAARLRGLPSKVGTLIAYLPLVQGYTTRWCHLQGGSQNLACHF